MGMSASLRQVMQLEGIDYEVLPHRRTATLKQAASACNLDLHQLVRAVVLADSRGLTMAVLPADHVLDFDALGRIFHRHFELVPGNQLVSIFADCERCSYPPVAAAYDLDIVVDSAVAEMEVITFEPGVHTSLVQISQQDFRKLTGDAPGGCISQPASSLASTNRQYTDLMKLTEQFTPSRLKRELEDIQELPALPGNSARLLQLAADPLSNAAGLAAIIEQDASLSAQVLRHANSSMYGYAGSIKDLQTAIARVLGFDYTLNLALGFSIGRALRVPLEGIYGQKSLWEHSVYCARLVEQLAASLPPATSPHRGTAYLAGLLQDLGRLVLGHTFQAEFFILNRFAQANPDLSPRELERTVLGVTHDQIGAWLLEAWGLPNELVTAVRHHHDEDYRERDALYPQLVLIANRALAEHGIGDGESGGLPASCLQMLGLEADHVRRLTEELLADTRDLDELAGRLAA